MEEKKSAVTEKCEVSDESNYNIDEKKESVHNRNSSNILFSKFTSSVWSEGKVKAESLFECYGKVDVLRPYFNVEPCEVLQRLWSSFMPVKLTNVDYQMPSELYGPLMICFTMVALLLFEMKVTGIKVQQGTLMGTAMLTCFGYWMGVSAVLYLLAYIGSTNLRPVQINTLTGYALTGHCMLLLLGLPIPINRTVFYILWLLCVGLCSVRVMTIFWAKTPKFYERIISSVVIVILHMGFMLYLHFAYYRIATKVVAVVQKI